MCSGGLVVRDQDNWTGRAVLSSQNVQGKTLVFMSSSCPMGKAILRVIPALINRFRLDYH